MSKQKKLPAMQFYPGDWLKDPNLRGVSLAAKGLWIDMLCLMHESDRRGYLLNNGKPITQDKLARMTGSSSEEVSQCLGELEDSGVFSCTPHGCIYSRRMVRDEERRQRAIEHGRRGGNPALKNTPGDDEDKGGVKGGDKGGDNPKEGSSVSSSTSVIEREKSEQTSQEIPDDLIDLAENVLGDTPVGQLRLLVLEGHPVDWIRLAVRETGFHGIKKGKRAVQYARSILQGWQEEGGPPKNDDNTSRNNGPGKRSHGAQRSREAQKGKYAHIDAVNFG